jgi:hypothetical protein
MTTDDTPDSGQPADDYDPGPVPERWTPESTFCTDSRGSFFAAGHRVFIGRIYKDTHAEIYRTVHAVDEEHRRAVLHAVERSAHGEFSPADDNDPLVVDWHEDGGRFLPV